MAVNRESLPLVAFDQSQPDGLSGVHQQMMDDAAVNHLNAMVALSHQAFAESSKPRRVKESHGVKASTVALGAAGVATAGAVATIARKKSCAPSRRTGLAVAGATAATAAVASVAVPEGSASA